MENDTRLVMTLMVATAHNVSRTMFGDAAEAYRARGWLAQGCPRFLPGSDFGQGSSSERLYALTGQQGAQKRAGSGRAQTGVPLGRPVKEDVGGGQCTLVQTGSWSRGTHPSSS